MENIIISIITGIVSIVTCLMTTRTSKKVDTALTSMMRNDITDMYYRNLSNKKLKQYERESLDKLYEGYIESGGNSFIKDIYAEMRKWGVER